MLIRQLSRTATGAWTRALPLARIPNNLPPE